MVTVFLDRVRKSLDGTLVLTEVTLEIKAGEFFFILGPSGSGKTTLLRLLAGFIRPDFGRIYFGDRDVTDLPPHRREVALVFQNYALFPHMTVWGNVAYGLRMRKLSKKVIRERVAEALELVQLADLANRYPSQLSGGQQQRVALARAIAVQPQVLLLDEPLSNLDVQLRLEMRGELKRLQRRLNITTLFVTHDQKEALSMADRLAVLNSGRILQVGTPTELYRFPKDPFVAQFLGDANVWEGTVLSQNADGVQIQTAVGILTCSPPDFPVQVGQSLFVMVRPEDLQVITSDQLSSRSNLITGSLTNVTYLGEATELTVQSGGTTIKVLHWKVWNGVERGTLTLVVAPKDLRLIPPNSPDGS
ncbi:MAG: ABC transporter ATP-binding protein [Armatimonadetes bacterium]|nr:ABC transporter ATP-binding protein [Armatimonadota bacterium]